MRNVAVWKLPSQVNGFRWLCSHVVEALLAPSLLSELRRRPSLLCLADTHSACC
jgi:hypothetical protein